MSEPSPALVYSDRVLSYDFGADHALQPIRYKLTRDLMDAYGLFASQVVRLLEPTQASDSELALVHDPAYIEAVKSAGMLPLRPMPSAGLGTSDNPVFPDMHGVSALVAGGSIQAARGVLDGDITYGFNIAGGLHHAHKSRASGFCIYDDPAVAIAWLLTQGVERVAYIDTDAHHGDGVQWLFYEDPRVLTVSIHESGRFLFPGTGEPSETGKGKGRGTAINIPLEPGASDADLLLALDEAVLPLVDRFRPEFLVFQHGCDTHYLDPLTHLRCTMGVYREIGRRERQLALEWTQGRAIAGGGGGYAFREVVPRAWLLTMAGFCDLEIAEPLPEPWRYSAGVKASKLSEDIEPDPNPLNSTKRTIRELFREVGQTPV